VAWYPFSQAQLIPVVPNTENEGYMILEDMIPNIVPDDGDTHEAPTKVIALENLSNGKVTPGADVRRIAEYAAEDGIKVHLDEARLRNACYANSRADASPAEAAKEATTLLRKYCASVDSVSLCLPKSPGAPAASALVGKSPVPIFKARHFRKARGGGLCQVGALTAAAPVAIDEVFLSGVHFSLANAIAKDLEEKWIALGGEV
jgi:threonine aldolase